MKGLRKSGAFICFVCTGAVLLVLMFAHAGIMGKRLAPQVKLRAGLVSELGLSDLCLFTEARYTRHLSQADLNTAFQDHPLSLEHFPSGSLVLPPAHITKGSGSHGNN